MPKLEIKNTSGKAVGSIDLDEAVFGAEVHEHLLWEVVRWQLAKRRAGTASTKRLGEVRGSSKKVWKQKGTGQARQGSRQAPHWVGGGSVFGPKPRSYAYDLPRKVKKAALRAALSLRATEQKIVVLENFTTDGKTKSVAKTLEALFLSRGDTPRDPPGLSRGDTPRDPPGLSRGDTPRDPPGLSRGDTPRDP